MRTRNVGSLEVTVAGLGCNNFGMKTTEAESTAIVGAALDAGITNFDTADEYGGGQSEEHLGRALGSRRHDVVITTKFGSIVPDDGSRPASPQAVVRSCEESLRRLGTDCIDLYLLHHPDPGTPIADTLGALAGLVRAGKVREIGCSNFTAAMLDDADRLARERGVPGFVNVQNNYSLLDRTPELEVVPTCERLGMTLAPYFPLASGMLTGKYRRGVPFPAGSRMAAVGEYFPDLFTDEAFDVVEALEEYAAAHGRSLHDRALSWLASQPFVSSVIAGATSPEQVRANAAATEAWELSAAERDEVAALTRIDHSFAMPIQLRDGPLHRD
jgi:aryl-alcohol dehydrogenase-like predicted oxidoreductase